MTLDLSPDHLDVVIESDDHWGIELSLVHPDGTTPIDLDGWEARLEGNPPWFTAAISDPPAGKVLLTLKPADESRKTEWKLVLTDPINSRVAVTGTVFVT
jgi:hypothetical protein